MQRIRLGLVAVVGSFGCARDSAPPEEGAPSVVVDANVRPSAPAATTTTPAPTIAAAPKSAPVAPAPSDALPEVDQVAPELVLVGEFGIPNDGSVLSLLQSNDGKAFAAVGAMLYVLEADGSLVHDDAWTRGIAGPGVSLDAADAGMFWWNATAIGGGWPDGAYLVLQPGTGSRGGNEPAELYRRNNAAWTQVDTKTGKLFWFPRAFGPWKDGSLLALKAFTTRYSTDDDGDVERPPAEVRAFESAVARQKKLVVLHGAPKAPALGDVHSFASLASGEIFALVGATGEVAMTHVSNDGERTIPLPEAAHLHPGSLTVRASAPDRAFVFGSGNDDTVKGYLARWDGTSWTTITNDCQAIATLAIDSSGSPWLACTHDAARDTLMRLRDGALERIAFAAEPQEIVARAPDDVWVLSGGDDGSKLWHTATGPKQPIELGGLDGVRIALAYADAHPLVDGCWYPWIPLASGSDRAEVEKKLAPLADDEIYGEVIEARVQGEVVSGVKMPGSGGKGVVAKVNRVVAALGDSAGRPSCNDRPPLVAQEP